LIDVPWDQALDAILRNRNLKKIEVGNVIRIIPGEKMLKEKEKKKD
jgi:type II secretory pathway component HofQ